jgi:hypothetical protein
MTHRAPEGWNDTPFVFVTDGIESAIEQARQAARPDRPALLPQNVPEPPSDAPQTMARTSKNAWSFA